METSCLRSYSALLGTCGKPQQWERALTLFGDMRRHVSLPGSASYGAAVRACESGRRWQRALLLLSEIQGKTRLGAGLSSCDAIKYASVMEACIAGNQWRRALQL